MFKNYSSWPSDPTLRNEYCMKICASSLAEAHFLIIYIDESLFNELGVIKPQQIIDHPNVKQKKLSYENFLIDESAIHEAKSDFILINKKSNALTLFPHLYYGFWGTVYNSILDSDTHDLYDILKFWLTLIDQNFRQIKQSNTQHQAVMNVDNRCIVTTLIEAHCRRYFEEKVPIYELRGSVAELRCARLCNENSIFLPSSYRFPVKQNFEVEVMATPHGFDVDETFGQISPFQQQQNATIDILSRQQKPKIDPNYGYRPMTINKQGKPIIKDRVAFIYDLNIDQPKSNRLKQLDLTIDDFSAEIQELIKECDAEVQLEKAEFKYRNAVYNPRSTHPRCQQCNSLLKFNVNSRLILPKAFLDQQKQIKEYVNFQLNAKQQLTVAKQRQLNFDHAQRAQQVNNHAKLVILEIGYSEGNQRVHQNNINALINCFTNAKLFRIGTCQEAMHFIKPDQRVVKFPNSQETFKPLDYCFPIISGKVVEAVKEINKLYSSRSTWISEFEDQQKRAQRFFQLKK